MRNEDVLESQEPKVDDDQLELDLDTTTIEIRRSRYVKGYQYHVDFRNTDGKVSRTLPAPAWAWDLYQKWVTALHRAERAEENLALAQKRGAVPEEERAL